MSHFHSVLVADDEASVRHVLTLALAQRGLEVRAVSDGEEALKELAARPYDVLISDVRMPKMDGLALLQAARALHPDLTVVVMSAYGTKELALEAIKAGAYDFVQKPFRPEEILFVLQKAEERGRLVRENLRLRNPGLAGTPLDRLVGQSEQILEIKRQIARVAPVSNTVVITGESGTGKELVARAIHDLSPRAAMSFVALNCGAVPEGLVESELFGHARGAFTDARVARRGLFAEADGGTLFLDEVGELPPAVQVKLLRVLQEGEVRAVGENRVEKVDVRVVAATNRDLSAQVARGAFREDLFFRLNVFAIRVPSLRERQSDILPLARLFLARAAVAFNREPRPQRFSAQAEAALLAHQWPGNVRELQHAVERAALLSDGPEVQAHHLPEALPVAAAPTVGALVLPAPADYAYSLKRAMRSLEEQFIRAALRKTRGNRTHAAELLEISHRALLYKLKEFGIDADREGLLPEP